MPFGRCPVCGASYHLNVSVPIDEWYRRYWPQVPLGEEVPGECIRCWVELRPGHRVTVRDIPAGLEGLVSVGAPGVVVEVEPGSPPICVVALKGASVPQGKFRRTDLYYVPGQHSQA